MKRFIFCSDCMKRCIWPTKPDRFSETDIKPSNPRIKINPEWMDHLEEGAKLGKSREIINIEPSVSFFKNWNKVALWNLANQLFKKKR